MILSFSVENFRSFKTAQTMTFRALSDPAHQESHCIATRIRAMPRVVRAAILIGPNSGGKSNFLAAFEMLREIVVHSGTHTEVEFSRLFTPFYGPETAACPTIFTIDVVLASIRYQYVLAYNGQRIVFEELHTSITKKPQRWYSRRYCNAKGVLGVLFPRASRTPGSVEECDPAASAHAHHCRALARSPTEPTSRLV